MLDLLLAISWVVHRVFIVAIPAGVVAILGFYAACKISGSAIPVLTPRALLGQARVEWRKLSQARYYNIALFAVGSLVFVSQAATFFILAKDQPTFSFWTAFWPILEGGVGMTIIGQSIARKLIPLYKRRA